MELRPRAKRSRAGEVADQTEAKHLQEKQMKHVVDESRRRLLKSVAVGVALMPIAPLPLRIALAADLPLLTSDDPAAMALKYVSDASKSNDAKPGSKCANCTFYQGAAGSAQGGCPLFPNKAVKAAGWCTAWAAKT
jgi:High potential iron-sulfur protein